MNFKLDSIGKKISFGYGAMIISLIISVLIIISMAENVDATADRLHTLRAPALNADLELMAGVHQSISQLRGWVMLGKDTNRSGRRKIWDEEIRPPMAVLKGLTEKVKMEEHEAWVNEVNRLEGLLQTLDQYQTEVENVAATNQQAAEDLIESKMVNLNKEITGLIDAMRRKQEKFMNDDQVLTTAQLSNMITVEWSLLAFLSILCIIFSWFITRSIVRPVARAVNVAENIGDGNLDTDISVSGSTELAALGNAMVRMRDALIKKEQETQQYKWLSTGKNELSDVIQGDKDVTTLVNDVIEFIANYTEANIGSVYLKNEQRNDLELAGKYAFSNSDGNGRYGMGEGLIGQVASAKKPIMLHDVDEKSIRVKSTLVDIPPRNVLVSPFLFEDRSLGVIELGKPQAFEEIQLEFVKGSMETLGVAVNTAITKMKIQQLLDEATEKGTQLANAKREIEQQLEGLNDVALVSITDVDGNITYVNDRFVKVSKFPREELIGQNHRMLKSGKQPDGLFVGMWKAITTGRVWSGEIINKAKDGSYYWVDTTIVPILNVNGKIEKFISVRFEITELKEQQAAMQKLNGELQTQQEELQQSNEELEEQAQKLKEQQEELQAANEELEEQTQVVEQKNKDLETARTDIELKAKQLEISSKYKSEFLANMSHELRTPLNSLLILAGDLSANKEKNLTEDQVESAQVISKSGQDLLILINEILDLSKIEAGKMDLNISKVTVHEIAADIRRNFKRQASEKGLDLSVVVEDGVPETIQTDRQRMDQVIKNLISNALKFTEEGSVKITFRKDAGSNLNVMVSDTGIGIPKDKQDVIFEAFQQADGGTARKYGGTGLGLSISRELAKLLGGNISLESDAGKGSTFTLSIPLIISKGDGKPAEEVWVKHEPKQPVSFTDNRYLNVPGIDDQRDQITKDDLCMLIIDDDLGFARVLAKQANEKGFKYLAATTGEDGLALASKFMPHAILLDIDLPGIDGHMVLKELKGNPALRHIPVHIMSVNEKTLDPIRSGALEYLTKPVTKPQLEEAFSRIEDFINRKMKNLLIVEDNNVMRKSIKKLIGNGDVKCVEASTGKQALEILDNQQVDCMVLDIGLPDMTGFELIHMLEERKKEKKVPPIIVYTGKELTREENEELRMSADSIIIKGVKSEERLLDETALFLHRTVNNLPDKKQGMITSLYDKERLFHDKHVLLVDDDMRNIFALSKVLKDQGFIISKAENGIVALEALKEQPHPDIVLMDIMMPEMDGYDCMREIRKNTQFRNLPIIALTAKAMKEDRQKCIDAGANDYISKPVDIERLLSLMRIWIKE
ncbi:MAG: response regulator [Flavobacteriales bacterium]|nr:response regulator [Flavobacteriales bacterium]